VLTTANVLGAKDIPGLVSKAASIKQTDRALRDREARTALDYAQFEDIASGAASKRILDRQERIAKLQAKLNAEENEKTRAHRERMLDKRMAKETEFLAKRLGMQEELARMREAGLSTRFMYGQMVDVWKATQSLDLSRERLDRRDRELDMAAERLAIDKDKLGLLKERYKITNKVDLAKLAFKQDELAIKKKLAEGTINTAKAKIIEKALGKFYLNANRVQTAYSKGLLPADPVTDAYAESALEAGKNVTIDYYPPESRSDKQMKGAKGKIAGFFGLFSSDGDSIKVTPKEYLALRAMEREWPALDKQYQTIIKKFTDRGLTPTGRAVVQALAKEFIAFKKAAK